jgi:hypothetical protein
VFPQCEAIALVVYLILFCDFLSFPLFSFPSFPFLCVHCLSFLYCHTFHVFHFIIVPIAFLVLSFLSSPFLHILSLPLCSLAIALELVFGADCLSNRICRDEPRRSRVASVPSLAEQLPKIAPPDSRPSPLRRSYGSFCVGWKSSIFEVWAAPAAPQTIPEGLGAKQALIFWIEPSENLDFGWIPLGTNQMNPAMNPKFAKVLAASVAMLAQVTFFACHRPNRARASGVVASACVGVL